MQVESRPRIPVVTITGRTGVLVDVDERNAVVLHNDGTVQRYARTHVSYAGPHEVGALWLDSARWAAALDAARGLG